MGTLEEELQKELRFLRSGSGATALRMQVCPKLIETLRCPDAVSAVVSLRSQLDALGDDMKVLALKNAYNIDTESYNYGAADRTDGVVGRRAAFAERVASRTAKQVENWENEVIRSLAASLAAGPVAPRTYYSVVIWLTISGPNLPWFLGVARCKWDPDRELTVHREDMVDVSTSEVVPTHVRSVAVEVDKSLMRNATKLHIVTNYPEAQSPTWSRAGTLLDATLYLSETGELREGPNPNCYMEVLPASSSNYVVISW